MNPEEFESRVREAWTEFSTGVREFGVTMFYNLLVEYLTVNPGSGPAEGFDGALAEVEQEIASILSEFETDPDWLAHHANSIVETHLRPLESRITKDVATIFLDFPRVLIPT